MRAYTSRLSYRKSGFTIVEFMVATAVFGVVLMGVTAAILHMSRLYQQSLYASSTQAATRNLVDTVGQAVQFSDSTVATGAYANGTQSICVGSRGFFYVIGKQLGGSNPSTSTNRAVMTYINPSDSGCPSAAQVNNYVNAETSRELLGKSMRLSRLDIAMVSPSLYKITARVVYGDDDLLCSPSITGSCTSNAVLSQTNLGRPDLMCKPTKGSQYCAVSELSTTVHRRL